VSDDARTTDCLYSRPRLLLSVVVFFGCLAGALIVGTAGCVGIVWIMRMYE